MQSFVDFLNGIIWSPALIYLCLGAGLFNSVLTRFVQVRHFFEMWRLLLNIKEPSKGSPLSKRSPYHSQAVWVLVILLGLLPLSVSVARCGILDVDGCVFVPPPRMQNPLWLKFIKKKTTVNSVAAPLTTSKSHGSKWYAWVCAIATIFACGVLLPGVQSNSISNAVESAFGSGPMIKTALGTFSFAKIFSGTVISIQLGFIIFGGVKRIASFTPIVVPLWRWRTS